MLSFLEWPDHYEIAFDAPSTAVSIVSHDQPGADPGGHGGQKTPLPELYWETLKSGVVA